MFRQVSLHILYERSTSQAVPAGSESLLSIAIDSKFVLNTLFSLILNRKVLGVVLCLSAHSLQTVDEVGCPHRWKVNVGRVDDSQHLLRLVTVQ